MKDISRAYIVALVVIASIITFGQYLLQLTIQNSEVDSRIINISGRQRMLSQKISKSAYGIVYADEQTMRQKSLKELEEAYKLWSSSHSQLQIGGEDLSIDETHQSETIKSLFAEIKPYYQYMEIGVLGLLEQPSDSSLSKSKYQEHLAFILQNEKDFLRIMDAITFQFDEEAQRRIEDISRAEYVLYFIAIVALILEGLFIFRPAISRLKESLDQLLIKEKALAKAEERKKYIKELESKNEELRQFSYITSHDLQEPVRNIMGHANLLKSRHSSSLNEEGQMILGFMEESATQMSNLIKDLLMYSRVGQSKDLEEVNCHELVSDILAGMNFSIEESGAKVDVEPLPRVQGYPFDLKVLFQNLISNAIKYRKPEGQHHIEVRSTMKNGFYYFTVSDNGIGISDTYFKKVFEVFQRLHTNEEFEGTGIGLAMCKKVVEKHSGEIWVESSLGEGSAFHFTIPIS